jgi:hypothetical protein
MNTMLETLHETLEYYGEDSSLRGIRKEEYRTLASDMGKLGQMKITSSCQYVVTNGDKKFCAVGRCMLEELHDWAHDVSGSVEDLISEYWSRYLEEDEDVRDVSEGTLMNEMMKPEYRHPVKFWSALQGLHDTDTAWSPTPGVWLTHTGKDNLREVLNVISDIEGNHYPQDEFLKSLINENRITGANQ